MEDVHELDVLGMDVPAWVSFVLGVIFHAAEYN